MFAYLYRLVLVPFIIGACAFTAPASPVQTPPQPPAAQQPAAQPQEVTIRFGQGPFISGGGLFIAMEKGYFRQVGITIDVKWFADGALVNAPLTNGEVDMGGVTLAPATFNGIAKGGPYKLILDEGIEYPGHGYVGLNVSQELYNAGVRGLSELAMLRGKKIGVTAPGSINHYVTARALIAVGLDPRRDVDWHFGVPQPDLVKLFGTKQVDAVNLAYQFSAAAEQQGFGPIIGTGADVEPYVQIAVIAARNDYVARNRDTVERFTMAYLQGVREYNATIRSPDAHPDNLAVLAKYTTLDTPEKLKAIWPHWTWVSTDGAINVQSVMAQQDFWADYYNSMVERKVAETDLIDQSILRSATERLQREQTFRGS
ncbi:MAG TPA: ABC transporter substrate-binding protein [Chloroflexota bacterium]|nr:ABC transporter substrate-binding protein [Chloroflexota bacterium]